MDREELRKLKARAIVLAEGKLGELTGKTCNILVMYSGWRRVIVRSVIDSRYSGRDAGDVLGIGFRGIPVVSNIEEALNVDDVDTLIVGISPVGGRLPEKYREYIRKAIENRLNIWSGLHIFISEDSEFRKLAEKYGVEIVDFRKPPKNLRIWDSSILKTRCIRILVSGTDCSVGKNVTSIEIVRELERRGYKVGLVGTGQTMLMVGADAGTVVDAIPADFVPGEVEKHVVDLDKEGYQIVIVEGQASLLHPAYSQVTLGIYYGTMPHMVVLCHDPWRVYRESFEHIGLKMPDIEDEIKAIKIHIPSTEIVAISVMGKDRKVEDVENMCEILESRLGIPSADPRHNVKKIVDVIEDKIKKIEKL